MAKVRLLNFTTTIAFNFSARTPEEAAEVALALCAVGNLKHRISYKASGPDGEVPSSLNPASYKVEGAVIKNPEEQGFSDPDDFLAYEPSKSRSRNSDEDFPTALPPQQLLDIPDPEENVDDEEVDFLNEDGEVEENDPVYHDDDDDEEEDDGEYDSGRCDCGDADCVYNR